jgi:hypothetical protein
MMESMLSFLSYYCVFVIYKLMMHRMKSAF